MTSYVLCSCCAQPVAVTPADVGRAVVCPRSRRLVLVAASDLRTDPAGQPRTGGARGRWLAAALVLLLAGTVGLVVWLGLLTRPLAERPADGTTDDPGQSQELTARANTGGLTVDQGTARSAGAGPTPLEDMSSEPRSPLPGSLPIEPREPDPTGTTGVRPNTVPPTGGTEPSTPGTVIRDRRGMLVHKLAKRIDLRTDEELQRELLAVREVALDVPAHPRTSPALVQLAGARQAAGFPYPGPMIAARGREDLAGLPFLTGPGTVLLKPQAEALDALSRQLREAVQRCVGANDPRPDPDQLYALLLAGREPLFRDRKWATAEAVPCIQQMLQAEGQDVRRMSVELLRGIETSEATEALVRWAVFDTAAENRAAAVEALRARDAKAVGRALLAWLRYPWPRAAEHAAEALVALEYRSVVPDLVALLALPAPTAPQTTGVAGESRPFRRELVRVNHPKNCVMCHAPSGSDTDLVRGAVPDPSRPLPGATTPGYYRSGGSFVSATTTYLRQDFSTVLPVPNPGQWSQYQRFDFLVAVRPARVDESAPRQPDPFQTAVLFALRELTGRDLGTSAADWAALKGDVPAPNDRVFAEAARFIALFMSPDPLAALALNEFGTSFLALEPSQRAIVIAYLQRQYGAAGARRALVAFLAGFERSDDATTRARAAELLAAVLAGRDPAVDARTAAQLLGDKSARLRAAGAAGLGSLGAGAKNYYKELIKALQDPEAEVRTEAASALGDLKDGPEEIHIALARATQDAAGRVRLAAADALKRMLVVPESAAEPLAAGLVLKGTWDSNEDRAAFEKTCLALIDDLKHWNKGGFSAVLRAATGDAPTDLPKETVAKLLSAMRPAPKKSLPALVPLLADPAYRGAADGLLFAAGDDGVDALLAGLKHERPAVRAAAATALGHAASLTRQPPPARESWRAASDALAVMATKDSSEDVRRAAAEALPKLVRSNP